MGFGREGRFGAIGHNRLHLVLQQRLDPAVIDINALRLMGIPAHSQPDMGAAKVILKQFDGALGVGFGCHQLIVRTEISAKVDARQFLGILLTKGGGVAIDFLPGGILLPERRADATGASEETDRRPAQGDEAQKVAPAG